MFNNEKQAAMQGLDADAQMMAQQDAMMQAQQEALAQQQQNRLDAIHSMVNVAEDVDDDERKDIARIVVDGFKRDLDSMEEWFRRAEEAIKLGMLISEPKNYPWAGAANVKYPIIATAAMQFSSRVESSVVSGDGRVVKAKVMGNDPTGQKADRATRVSRHMSWQRTTKDEEWLENVDKCLTALPVLGVMFKKTYFDPISGVGRSELIWPQNLIAHYTTKTVESSNRLTHRYKLTPNQLEEQVRAGVFLDCDYGEPSIHASGDSQQSGEITTDDVYQYNDEDRPHTMLEQHCWYDLDGDGYKEPYIITVHHDSGKLARMVARWDDEGVIRDRKNKILRIEPVHYITRIPFLEAPDGNFYGQGFGSLLGPVNKTVNQVINQLLDSGTLQNTGGGFLGNGIQFGRGKIGGDVRFKPGEWKRVNMLGDDIRRNVFPMPVPQTSPVLFQLLGLMIDSSEKLSSVTDVLTGEANSPDMPATTTLALIEQGLKVFNSIFKRIHRAFKKEYKKLYRLNRLYLDQREYFYVNDVQYNILAADYDDKNCDVYPVSNPNESTDTEKMIKAQALLQLRGTGLNDQEIMLRYLEALGINDREKLLQVPPPQPNPLMIMEMEKLKIEQGKFALDRFKFEREMLLDKYKIAEVESRTIKNLATAEAEEAGPQLQQYKIEAENLTKRYMADAKQQLGQGQGQPQAQPMPQQDTQEQDAEFSPDEIEWEVD